MVKEDLQMQLAAAKEFFDRSTRSLTEADSGFAPVPGMYTVSQQVAHAAQTVDWFFEGAFAAAGFDMNMEKLDREIKAEASLQSARAWFEKACAAAKATIEAHSEEEWMATIAPGPVFGGAPRVAILGGLTDHTAHHRGALAVYARLLGRVPPMPYADM